MKKRAHELEFISQVVRDGSGTVPMKPSYLEALERNPLMADEYFELKPLSLTNKTFVAFNFNVFVVKLKYNTELKKVK